MPSTTSSTVSTVVPNSTLTIPLSPTRSSASATMLPVASSLAAMIATARVSRRPLTGRAMRLSAATASLAASSSPCTSSTGLAPWARQARPCCTIASASTVAVVVPSPATWLVCCETSRTTCAPMFSNGHSSSISWAMLTPSRETIGVPTGRSMMAFIPLGPSVPRTAFASLATPRPRASLAASSCSIILAILVSHDRAWPRFCRVRGVRRLRLAKRRPPAGPCARNPAGSARRSWRARPRRSARPANRGRARR